MHREPITSKLAAGAGKGEPQFTMRNAMGPTDVELGADPELVRVARRLFWWESPAQSLADPLRFTAQVMALGTWNDIGLVKAKLGETAFAQVLDRPRPGIFSPRRWNYWHVRLQRLPVPPLPQRFPG